MGRTTKINGKKLANVAVATRVYKWPEKILSPATGPDE